MMPEIEEWHWSSAWRSGDCSSQPWICVRVRDDLLLGWSTEYKEFEAFNPSGPDPLGGLHRPNDCGRKAK